MTRFILRSPLRHPLQTFLVNSTILLSQPAKYIYNNALYTTTSAFDRAPPLPTSLNQPQINNSYHHRRKLHTTTSTFKTHLRKMSSENSPPPTETTAGTTGKWQPANYMKFGNERTRPVYDLISQVLPHIPSSNSPLTIYDLGCGPGNSTQALLSFFPTAHITGLDSSREMISAAQNSSWPASSNVEFAEGDISTFTPPPATDLVFSNAVFHWLRSSERLPALVKILQGLKSGAVLAFQVPDNYDEPSHRLMRDIATLPSTPWTPFFQNTRIGDISDSSRPDLDPIEAIPDIYDAFLSGGAASISVWRTEYQHALAGPGSIVEWVRTTGLRPFLDRTGDEEGVRRQFLEAYEEAVGREYRELKDGRVLLRYPRLFCVVVKK
jgi:trans-aconitate 2-methyltransferase